MEVRVTVDVRRKRKRDDMDGLVFDDAATVKRLKENEEYWANGGKGYTLEELDREMDEAIAEGATLGRALGFNNA
ncbi:hypothetical protein FACS18949_04110 [Clostridia bacterium]|nr:hypothetical protein FACS189425_11070 [Clostridia bacterium]GHV32620.1 hypothetical protein FACS18949_04110 [Clostridia bacterium]